jgi:predicted HicB family RNase H-like nuclease
MADHYTYRVSWSEEDQEFIGACIEFPSLSHLAESRAEALRGIEDLVRDVVGDMQANGERPPVPIADQHFSGQFMTRVPKELHRRLSIEAAEAGISLNRLVSFKLTTPVIDTRPVPARTRSSASRKEKLPA